MPETSLMISTVACRVGIRGKDRPNLSLQFKPLFLSEVTLSLLLLLRKFSTQMLKMFATDVDQAWTYRL